MTVLSGVTISVASPAVFTYTSHGLTNGQAVFFRTAGTLPTGITAESTYYVMNAADNTFNVSSLPNGTAVNTTGTSSGTHTGYTQNFLASPLTPFNMSTSDVWYKCNFACPNLYTYISKYTTNYTTGYDALGNGVAFTMKFTWNANVTALVWAICNPNNLYVDRDVTFFLSEKLSTVTLTVASPCVVTYNSHPLSTGDGIEISTSGALPTGLSPVATKSEPAIYWINKIDANTFWLYRSKAEALVGGSTGRIVTSGTQSGTHTLYKVQRTTNFTLAQLYPSGPTHYTGQWIVNVPLDTPIAVTTSGDYIVGAWYGQGTSNGTFGLCTSGTGSTPNYYPTCFAVTDQTATFQSGQDFQIIRSKMTIDGSFTMKDFCIQGTLMQSLCGWVVPSGQYTFGNTTMMHLPSSLTGPTTINVYGGYYFSPGSGFQVGESGSAISLSNKVTITAKGMTQGATSATYNPGFMRTSQLGSTTMPNGMWTGDVYLYGSCTANRLTTTTNNINATYASTSFTTGTPGKVSNAALWAGENVWFTVGVSSGTMPGGINTGTLYQMRNKSGSTYDVYDKDGNPVTVTTTGSSPISSPVLELAEAVDWDIGDKIAFGPEPTAGAGTTSTYAIGDMNAAKTRIGIGYTGSQQWMAVVSLAPGSYVMNGTKYSIAVDCDLADVALFYPGNHCYISKVAIYRTIIGNPGTCYLDKNAGSTHQLVNCVAYGTTSGRTIIQNNNYIPQNGLTCTGTIINYMQFLYSIIGNSILTGTTKRASGAITLTDTYAFHGTMVNYGSSNPLGLAVKWIVSNFYCYNNVYTFTRSGIGSTWNNFRVYGANCSTATGDTQAVICYKNAIGCTATNDYIDYVNTVVPYIAFNNGTSVIDLTMNTPKFDTIYDTTPTAHVGLTDVCYLNNVKMISPNKNIIVDTTLQQNIADGSAFTVLNWNSVTNDDRNYYKYGNMVRTGTSLGDTTAHASGFAMRFQPNSGTDSLRYSKNIPTGNIQNKTATIAVWCKLNSANYYAGTYQMPRLEVNYDNGTVAYTSAAQTTDWQLLTVTFVSTSTYGQITVTFDTRTNASASDAYVYFDDFSMLYPAGTTLNLGTFDLWANGEPIAPYISTTIAAADVWAVSASGFGAGTIGAQVGTIKSTTDTINTNTGTLSTKLDTMAIQVDDASIIGKLA